MGQLEARGDNQIMSLEMLAVLVSLSTHKERISGRRVVLWSDSTGAEHATRRGSSSKADHNTIVHRVWAYAYQHDIKLWIERVGTDDNVADNPSRANDPLMVYIGAKWSEPVLTGWDDMPGLR